MSTYAFLKAYSAITSQLLHQKHGKMLHETKMESSVLIDDNNTH